MPLKPRFNSAEEIERLADAYFAHCESSRVELPLKNGDVRVRQTFPTMIGLAQWLGISKAVLYRYLDKTALSENSPVSQEEQQRMSDAIACARDRIESTLLQAAAEGSIEPRTAQLLLNSFGYAKQADTETAVTVRIAGAAQEAESWSM